MAYAVIGCEHDNGRRLGQIGRNRAAQRAELTTERFEAAKRARRLKQVSRIVARLAANGLIDGSDGIEKTVDRHGEVVVLFRI